MSLTWPRLELDRADSMPQQQLLSAVHGDATVSALRGA
jgi:hypothetical protein